MLEKYLDSIQRPEEVGTSPQIMRDIFLEVDVDRGSGKQKEGVMISELLYEENAIYLLVIEESESLDKHLVKSIIGALHPLYGIVVTKGSVIARSFDCSGKKSKRRNKNGRQPSNNSHIDTIFNKINKCVLLSPDRIPDGYIVFRCNGIYAGDKVYWPIKDHKLYNPIELNETTLFQFTGVERVKTILDNKEDSMTSLLAMNDKSEYAGWSPVSNWNNLPVSVDKEIFIKSLCKEKSLDMWRLYGNDGKGACIEYECAGDISKGYVLNPVCYNTELLQVYDLFSKTFKRLQIVPNGHLFRHFLKFDHYKIENEVRLLYMNYAGGKVSYYNSAAGKIIPVINISQPNFPLKIKKIWLGWRCPYIDRNIVSLGMIAPNLDIEMDSDFLDYVGN